MAGVEVAERYDALIVGSGFGGSLLGRVLARRGWSVLLVDRARHPRFAIGESTTPLANLALERLASRYDMPQLHGLATYGRWMEQSPEIRRGLKRGFSFYLQQPGERWSAGPDRRLLVAASPDERVADTHWLRSDVDQALARWAVADGVELFEETELKAVEVTEAGVEVELSRHGEAIQVRASLLIDASGPSGAVCELVGQGGEAVAPRESIRTSSGLLFAHFEGVGRLGEGAPGDPYPEDRAAIHHLLEEGWMYLLHFDHGVTSAGILLAGSPEGLDARAADVAWHEILRRYPTLDGLFETARPLAPIAFRSCLQHRRRRAFGRRWVALPHTFGFIDPLFSTGIAWSLLAVERLAEVLTSLGPDADDIRSGESFARYGDLLLAEFEAVDRLVATAYKLRHDLALFAAWTMLYFARVSFAESRQRLCHVEDPWWEGFLGAADESAESLLVEASGRAERVLAGEISRADFTSWMAEAIEPFNVAGLADAARDNLYPADPGTLVENAAKLDLEPSVIEAALPRLLAGS